MFNKKYTSVEDWPENRARLIAKIESVFATTKTPPDALLIGFLAGLISSERKELRHTISNRIVGVLALDKGPTPQSKLEILIEVIQGHYLNDKNDLCVSRDLQPPKPMSVPKKTGFLKRVK